MGNSCTSAADAVAHLITENEIHEAVRSIEEWQQAQATAVRVGGQSKASYGPLLQRVGGIDVVKQVVELFYSKLYGDPRLILFLHDQDIMHLRAKQSAFISWLFGPPNVPYMGRSVRIAHLRIIRQRGFCGEDFDLGMRYFEQAMTELGAPEQIVGEVMRRLRPFKDAFFTPSPRDAEEEARWAAEEREREEAAEEEERKRRAAEEAEEAYHEKERRLVAQITLAHRAAEAETEAEAGEAKEWAADAAVAAAVVASLGAGSRGATAPPSRAPTCPFTGGRGSRPTSAKVQDSSPGTAAAVAAAVAVATESPPPKPATPPAGGAAIACIPTPPRSQSPTSETARPDRPDSAGLGAASAAAAAATTTTTTEVIRVPSPAAPRPATPPVPVDRPGSAAVSTPTPAPPPLPPKDTPPAEMYEAELDEIERALAAGGGSTALIGEGAPSLPDAAVSDLRRTAAVC